MLYLASASPRRRELLSQLNIPYVVVTPEVDETPAFQEVPKTYVKRLAIAKAAAAQALVTAQDWILAADTAVIFQGQIFGKPRDAAEACYMLQQLSGHTHQVITAIALQCGENCLTALSETAVTFRTLSDAEIHAYVATQEPFDKAGSYAIQGFASIFIANIDGSYSGVMGLPLYETAALLQQTPYKIL